MNKKTFNSRVSMKHDTEANWNKATGFSPLPGEIIIYDADENNPVPRIKIGDLNETNVNDLPFQPSQPDWNSSSGPNMILNKPFGLMPEGLVVYDGFVRCSTGTYSGSKGQYLSNPPKFLNGASYKVIFNNLEEGPYTANNNKITLEDGNSYYAESNFWLVDKQLNGDFQLVIKFSEDFKQVIDSDYLPSTLVGKQGSGNQAEIFNDYEQNVASGEYSHAEGYETTADENYSHAEGKGTAARGIASHAEGSSTTTIGVGCHAEGISTTASGQGSHAEGSGTKASFYYSHAEGEATEANNRGAHAEGIQTIAGGEASHAEGIDSKAEGNYSHAEGNETTAGGVSSHSEGMLTVARGENSHAEGNSTTASGDTSHAEGCDTQAIGDYSHVEGFETIASGGASHAENSNTEAKGDASHAEGYCTIAAGERQHVQGRYNIPDEENDYAHIVGNGNSSKRSNAHTLDWDGNAWYAGSVTSTDFIITKADGTTTSIGDLDTALDTIIAIQEELMGENSVTLITFTIDGTEYQAEEGMTWGDWVGSEYDTKPHMWMEGLAIYNNDGYYQYIYTNDYQHPMNPNLLIESGYAYIYD